MNGPGDHVLARIEGHLGRITLNRPRALNALTYDMVCMIDAVLDRWADDDAVVAVLLDGAGERGLCAGGDIRALYAAALAGDLAVPRAFFAAEYRLNARIAAYPKPTIAFMDGIVMGGGIGLSAHGTIRVVTERSRLAMPETGIGFVVDVGGTWLLGRAPDELGTHAALTACLLGADDALLCGLADLFVPSDRLADLACALTGCPTAEAMRDQVQAQATAPAAGRLAASRGWIRLCYAADTMEAIMATLGAHDDPQARAAAADIAAKSPTSLKVTLRALRSTRHMSGLPAALEQEFRMALHAVQTDDFREGVRAAVIDKDRTPCWSPATLAEIGTDRVDAFFAPSVHGGIGLGGCAAP